jgi:flavin reductase (DIM6/NTAB) family NADH-FMN oxidoreductase RutF
MTPTSAAADTTAAAMREALSCFATGVTVVTSLLPDGHLIGVTANSFNSVSLDPPLILFSLNRRLRSFAAFNATERFAVDILGAHQKALSMQFAPVMGDQWHSVRYRVGERCGCLVLDNAHVALECAKWSSYDGGDHVIYVGRVLDTKVNPECAPLVFYRGR